MTAKLTGLATGTPYYLSVTAVDAGGNESACVPAVSAVAQGGFTVSPTGTVNFGNVTVGSVAEQTFVVQSTTRGGTVTGTATTSAPFSIVAGSSFNLVGTGAGQSVTVRFAPTAATTATTNVSFTADGDTQFEIVTGTGTTGGSTPPPTPDPNPCAGAGHGCLGYSVVGATTDTGDSHWIDAWSFTVPNESGIVTSVSVYIAGPVSPPPDDQFQIAIYSDANGSPGTLIAASNSATITPDSWNVVPLRARLLRNTSYWLAYNTNGTSDANNNVTLDPGDTGQMVWRAQPFGTWPTSFGTPDGASNFQASIFATYLPRPAAL